MDRENANLSAIPADGIRAAAKKQDFGTSRWQLGGFNSMSVQAAYKVGQVVGRAYSANFHRPGNRRDVGSWHVSTVSAVHYHGSDWVKTGHAADVEIPSILTQLGSRTLAPTDGGLQTRADTPD